ncbi:hydroxyethylthiazole kinase [Kaistia geumhonensis]|uniref:Hydroxyethylthiazole kinase n=1 Tax=Kaistia geumhonensis TaxID=410839 RepID=A0ABU0M4A4_9HYPH|nr:hydroxyethylthiazole kinase [Kaistia geumhonensis]MCX5478996.1 hydroxyethylthiazole kinase [Kaistia geumhonensis]MDQ0515784.1 hydroxyethylthiazole kinase [Kaistia geumhonensis]
MSTTATNDNLTITAAGAALDDLRAARPLVQNITNYVAMTISANVLLALGASPAMVHAPEEAADFAAISSSLVVNIGTLSESWVDGMRRAVLRMNEDGKPWVLDPVGCGATPYRTAVAVELSRLRPAIIRGNASEIMSLAGASGAGGKGVDSTTSSDAAIAAAQALARETGAVVAVTGETDYVTDGAIVVAITGGHALMPLSTALGCALSATVAAFAAIRPPMEAAVSALAVYGAAGALGAENLAGPGLLPAALCDMLYGLDAESVAAFAGVQVMETV